MKIGITKIIKESDRPLLVMLHGFGGSCATWKKQVGAFEDKFNIYIFELPGHGDVREGISSEQNVNMEVIAQLIIDELRKDDIKSAHFLALSLGTLVLASILQLAPEMVESVVLCGAVFGMNFWYKLALYFGNSLKYICPYAAVINLMANILLPRSSHKVSRKFLVRECKRLGRAEFMRWYTLVIKELDKLKNNSKLLKNVPSLVIMGDEDYVFRNRAVNCVKTLGGNIKLEIMKNCGHVCNIQDAVEFNKIIDAFFAALKNPEKAKAGSLCLN